MSWTARNDLAVAGEIVRSLAYGMLVAVSGIGSARAAQFILSHMDWYDKKIEAAMILGAMYAVHRWVFGKRRDEPSRSLRSSVQHL